MKRTERRKANRVANGVDAALVGPAKGSLDTTPATKFRCPECATINVLQRQKRHRCSTCGTQHSTAILLSGGWCL